MKLEEAIERVNKIKENWHDLLHEKYCYIEDDVEAMETVLQELDHLQKENEQLQTEVNSLKEIDLTTVHIKGVCDEKGRWRDKIRELILNKKQKIQENSKEIEECRKTIMEEQELKKLRLYTLHKNNDLLELEIADLFDLLKEE